MSTRKGLVKTKSLLPRLYPRFVSKAVSLISYFVSCPIFICNHSPRQSSLPPDFLRLSTTSSLVSSPPRATMIIRLAFFSCVHVALCCLLENGRSAVYLSVVEDVKPGQCRKSNATRFLTEKLASAQPPPRSVRRWWEFLGRSRNRAFP